MAERSGELCAEDAVSVSADSPFRSEQNKAGENESEQVESAALESQFGRVQVHSSHAKMRA